MAMQVLHIQDRKYVRRVHAAYHQHAKTTAKLCHSIQNAIEQEAERNVLGPPPSNLEDSESVMSLCSDATAVIVVWTRCVTKSCVLLVTHLVQTATRENGRGYGHWCCARQDSADWRDWPEQSIAMEMPCYSAGRYVVVRGYQYCFHHWRRCPSRCVGS